jgi:adenylate cyclase
MSDVVEENRGTIDKYIGDAVMAFWGAPSFMEDHGSLACRTALQCLRALEDLRAEWPEEWRDELKVRIGINSGRVIVGNIGSASRLNYTVVGDPVNLASRLEGTCKIYGVDCIIGQNTYELAKYDIVARRLDVATVKGRQEPVAIYELLAMADEAHPLGHFDWIHLYEKALGRYVEHDWKGALEDFRRVIELRGGDKPSEVFVARCEEQLQPSRSRAATPVLVA